MRLRYIWIMLICSFGAVGRGSAQELGRADTSAVILAALDSFNSSSGPVIGVQEQLGCVAPLGRPVDGSFPRCIMSAPDSAIWTFAMKTSISVVGRRSAVPACYSSKASQLPTAGRRMLLNGYSISNEVAEVTLEVRCSGFYNRTKFTVERLNGSWTITKVRLIEIT